MEIKNETNEQFNSERKKLLNLLDNGDYVSTIDLATYGLISYYDKHRMSDLSSSLYEKVLLLNLKDNKIKHIEDKDLSFMTEQIRALDFIKNNEKIILSAPTSFGKTLILKEYIYRFKPETIVFIVPTNALAYELELDFKNNSAFSEYEIFDKNKFSEETDNSNSKYNKSLFIGTQEKYLEIRHSIKDIDLFVIDEAYKLEDSVLEQRAYKLSKTFLDSIVSNCKKVCLLSPNAVFVGFEEYNFKVFETSFNAVDKCLHIIEESNFFDELKNAVQNKTILFCKSPSDASVIEPELPILNDSSTNFVEFIEKEFHPEWTVVKLLKKGILSHHGLMPKYLQNKMISLFNQNNDYNLLIGTNSISEGINTPTKNLFIYKSCNIKEKKLLIKNTIGRAGRLGKYPIGHIYSIDKDFENIIDEKIIIKLAITDEDNLNEIKDTEDNEKINEFCNLNDIEREFYDSKIEQYKMSIKRLQRIFDSLKKDRKYNDISNLPYMAAEAFVGTYFNASNDRFYIKGVLNNFYCINNKERKSLNTYNDKIEYIQEKIDNISKSEVMDGYMKFIYSTLDYTILPIASIAKDIQEEYPSWGFGKNVVESITSFRKKYYETFFGMPDFDELSQNEISIMTTLKEYGVNIIDAEINKAILAEIDNHLNKRYSTYDIMNAIKKLSRSESSHIKIYKKIVSKYIF